MSSAEDQASLPLSDASEASPYVVSGEVIELRRGKEAKLSKNSSTEDRMVFAKALLGKQPIKGPRPLMNAVKKQFGKGLSFYNAREIYRAFHKQDTDSRDKEQWIKNYFDANPSNTYLELEEAYSAHFKETISEETYEEYEEKVKAAEEDELEELKRLLNRAERLCKNLQVFDIRMRLINDNYKWHIKRTSNSVEEF